MMRLTVVVCTHNRADLLDSLIASLVDAEKPIGAKVDLLIVANACTDDTDDVITRWMADPRAEDSLPIKKEIELRKGKSYALNRALELLECDATVFVDDDHRVDQQFLVKVERALREWPEAGIICGRIVPDWDGSEPDWVHDSGPYKIYPPPIATFDAGSSQRFIENDAFKPGGGNIAVRMDVLAELGGFSTELGPQGHDFGGGEDSDFLRRAVMANERILYVPEIVQYHYVDPMRLRLSNLLQMSYARSRASARIHYAGGSAQLFMWRRVFGYALSALVSVNYRRTRFYLVRCAAALGEIRGVRDAVVDMSVVG